MRDVQSGCEFVCDVYGYWESDESKKLKQILIPTILSSNVIVCKTN